MSERLIGLLMNLLSDFITSFMESEKNKFSWTKLFMDTGEFFSNNIETLSSFEKELSKVFSKENMKELAKNLENEKGYNFPQVLHDELDELFRKFDLYGLDAESYINNFSQSVINYIEKNDTDKLLEMYLGEWKRVQLDNFDILNNKTDFIIQEIKRLSEKNITAYTINDIEESIIEKSRYSDIRLNFFEANDIEFQKEFEQMLVNKNVIINVIGQSREEALYRILNELRRIGREEIVYVIKNELDWKMLREICPVDKILIPYFYSEDIFPISQNINIFIFREDEPCYGNNKLKLRKRLKKNLVKSMEKIGIKHDDAYNIVNNTNGLYSSLKKRLFNVASYKFPDWAFENSDVLITALMLGKWTEAVGDILLFEELSGKKYIDCRKELEKYSEGENPFIIINNYPQKLIELASVEDAWEELDKYITEEIWERFILLFYEVLIESEPIFDYPFEKHFEASLYADKPEWSKVIKFGMIRTLIMRAYYRKHEENQFQIDKIVEKIFSTINSKERWAYISQYIVELCEASPNAVLNKLEEEFSRPSGLIELFSIDEGDNLTSRNYYVNILWGVEQLLQQKEYVTRAIHWLLKMDSYNIKYLISNSPKEILNKVFCAWVDLTALSVDQKINLSKEALNKYDNAWEIIAESLPSYNKVMVVNMNKPKYREVSEQKNLLISEVNDTYISYLYACMEFASDKLDRWIKLLDYIYKFNDKIIDDFFDKMLSKCEKMKDCKKIIIKNKIRRKIYKHSYFINSEWCMGKDRIGKLIKIMESISINEKEYEYLYLFSPEYEFPLLKPSPYIKEDNKSFEMNCNLRKQEIERKIRDFKNNKLSIEKLIIFALNNSENNIGDLLAEYYIEDNKYDQILNLLIQIDKKGDEILGFVRKLSNKIDFDLRKIIELDEVRKNKNLLVNLIKLEPIDRDNNLLIMEQSEEVKKYYWSDIGFFNVNRSTKPEVLTDTLDECYKFGTIDSYICIIYYSSKVLSPIILLEYLYKVRDMKRISSATRIHYCLIETLKILQNKLIANEEYFNKIAEIEWFFKDILEWNDMKCVQSMMKTSPDLYATLSKLLFKPEDKSNKESSDEDKKTWQSFYRFYNKANFCPTEDNEEVDYNKLNNWINKFRELLINQKQESLFGKLIGRLLPFSPVDKDGNMPCRAVRKLIEENFDESLKNSYIISEENKRGVYISDGGVSEKNISNRYKLNADNIQFEFPRTAEIYYCLSRIYNIRSNQERIEFENYYL